MVGWSAPESKLQASWTAVAVNRLNPASEELASEPVSDTSPRTLNDDSADRFDLLPQFDNYETPISRWAPSTYSELFLCFIIFEGDFYWKLKSDFINTFWLLHTHPEVRVWTSSKHLWYLRRLKSSRILQKRKEPPQVGTFRSPSSDPQDSRRYSYKSTYRSNEPLNALANPPSLLFSDPSREAPVEQVDLDDLDLLNQDNDPGLPKVGLGVVYYHSPKCHT